MRWVGATARFISGVFAPPCWVGPSCGERYWGEFYSDRPDCGDPCDEYGNWIGRGRWHGRGGCSTCGRHAEYPADAAPAAGVPAGEEVMSDGVAEPAPTPAPPPPPKVQRSARAKPKSEWYRTNQGARKTELTRSRSRDGYAWVE
jgi:hypothetical protein